MRYGLYASWKTAYAIEGVTEPSSYAVYNGRVESISGRHMGYNASTFTYHNLANKVRFELPIEAMEG